MMGIRMLETRAPERPHEVVSWHPWSRLRFTTSIGPLVPERSSIGEPSMRYFSFQNQSIFNGFIID